MHAASTHKPPDVERLSCAGVDYGRNSVGLEVDKLVSARPDQINHSLVSISAQSAVEPFLLQISLDRSTIRIGKDFSVYYKFRQPLSAGLAALRATVQRADADACRRKPHYIRLQRYDFPSAVHANFNRSRRHPVMIGYAFRGPDVSDIVHAAVVIADKRTPRICQIPRTAQIGGKSTQPHVAFVQAAIVQTESASQQRTAAVFRIYHRKDRADAFQGIGRHVAGRVIRYGVEQKPLLRAYRAKIHARLAAQRGVLGHKHGR